MIFFFTFFFLFLNDKNIINIISDSLTLKILIPHRGVKRTEMDKFIQLRCVYLYIRIYIFDNNFYCLFSKNFSIRIKLMYLYERAVVKYETEIVTNMK